MKVIHSISALMLAVLVLVSSTSFIVGMHICMGEIQNISVFDKAEGCQKEMALPACHRHMKPACCEDETILHEGSDFEASMAHAQIIAPAPVDIEQQLVLMSEVIPDTHITSTRYNSYDPPLRTCDLTVEHRILLI